jgi:4-hydroxyphenylpyruvate dioxygenase-like putative hemolysin
VLPAFHSKAFSKTVSKTQFYNYLQNRSSSTRYGMADILAAFEELEKQDRKKHPPKPPKATNTKFRNPLIS